MKKLGCLLVILILVGLVVALLLRAPKHFASQPGAPQPAAPAAPEAAPSPVVNAPEPEVVAHVSSASGSPIVVKHLQLSFSYEPSGQIISFYNPSDYPTLDAIPLSSGQRASFAVISKVVFINLSKREKVFVEEKDRANYATGAIDKEGYNSFTVQLIQATITTKSGETVVDTIECPDHSGVALVGNTSLGSFKRSLWGLKKPLVVDF